MFFFSPHLELRRMLLISGGLVDWCSEVNFICYGIVLPRIHNLYKALLFMQSAVVLDTTRPVMLSRPWINLLTCSFPPHLDSSTG